MNQKDFTIASRYLVQPDKNLVSDVRLQTEVRLEPRLMKLLCILSYSSGQLVTRERLVKEIWNDYGGGEDGLNHAISSLRKLFNDSSKALIETIPKKGYILHGEIASCGKQHEAGVLKEKKFLKQPILYASFIFGVAIVLFTLLYFQLKDKEDRETPASKAKEMNVPFSDVNKKIEETWLNTITTLGKDSTQYKVTIIGDRRPEFYINGRLLSPDEMENHFDLVNNLMSQLRKRTKHY